MDYKVAMQLFGKTITIRGEMGVGLSVQCQILLWLSPDLGPVLCQECVVC